MPIEYQIDHDRRFVSARAIGNLTAEDIFNYQREVWSLPEARGYNELIDMSNVKEIVSPTNDKLVDRGEIIVSIVYAGRQVVFPLKFSTEDSEKTLRDCVFLEPSACAEFVVKGVYQREGQCDLV